MDRGPFPTGGKRGLHRTGDKENANIYSFKDSFCQRILRHFVSRPTNPCERLYLRLGSPLGRDTVGNEPNVVGKLGALPSYLSACSASLAWYTRLSLSAMVRGYWDLSLRPA